MIPLWIDVNQGRALNPPAEVMLIGDQRSAENLIAAALALHVTEALRYQPATLPSGAHVTFCNIFAADWCQILKAPLPHIVGGRELRANDIFDRLKAQGFAGWTETGTIASALAVKNLATCGIPQVAVWKNPTGGPGHITAVIPSRDDRIWVAGAGAHCSDGCPIEAQFGHLPTTFFAFNG